MKIKYKIIDKRNNMLIKISITLHKLADVTLDDIYDLERDKINDIFERHTPFEEFRAKVRGGCEDYE